MDHTNKAVRLKAGKEKPIKNRHHWIFSGAIESLPEFSDGEVLKVVSHAGENLGIAYFNRHAKITGRMIAFGDVIATSQEIQEAIHTRLSQAKSLREQLFKGLDTTAYRLVNGEGDLLPGLIIDRYADVFVLQIGTLGMEKLKPLVVSWLKNTFHPRSIYEKSLLPSRKEEGLSDFQAALDGEIPAQEVFITENGVKFGVSILHGQKTGFFLDHREMRQTISNYCKGKRVLNCFAYTGGFSVYAALKGALAVDSVDISASAMAQAEKNMQLNGIDAAHHRFITADVFQFLREQPLDYDVVILDPPAFAKRQKDVVAACRGYKDINRVAMQKMPKNSLLMTSSCSYHVDEALFQTVVFQAAVESGKDVKIIGRHAMAPDHPINICHPESDYLKSLILFVT